MRLSWIHLASLILTIALGLPLQAQISITGTDPAQIQWNTFQTKHYQLIYAAGSDSLASVVLGTLYALGFRCPRDIGVIGFNNIDLSAHMVPPLTTIEVPTGDIGKAAVERMMQIILDKDPSIRRILFPTQLIERKSLK